MSTQTLEHTEGRAVDAQAEQGHQMLSRKEVATHLGVTVKWLEENRHTGPKYYRYGGSGPVRYKRRDVQDWLRQQVARA